MTVYKRASDRCTRKKLCLHGRAPAWRRENLVQFWQAIASGRSSEEAATEAGASTPLGPRCLTTLQVSLRHSRSLSTSSKLRFPVN